MTTPVRCPWCGNDPLYQAYHDHEWGVPSYDDRHLFAMLCLEAMQAGLSWYTILKKRPNYYAAFDDFDPDKIAQYDTAKVDRLMQNTGIVRHRKKIEAIIANARAYQAISTRERFCDYLWRTATPNGAPVINHPKSINDLPSHNEYAVKLAKQLKQDGFKFVGATTCYAFMQAVGMVNDHLIDCAFRHQERS